MAFRGKERTKKGGKGEKVKKKKRVERQKRRRCGIVNLGRGQTSVVLINWVPGMETKGLKELDEKRNGETGGKSARSHYGKDQKGELIKMQRTQ